MTEYSFGIPQRTTYKKKIKSKNKNETASSSERRTYVFLFFIFCILFCVPARLRLLALLRNAASSNKQKKTKPRLWLRFLLSIKKRKKKRGSPRQWTDFDFIAQTFVKPIHTQTPSFAFLHQVLRLRNLRNFCDPFVWDMLEHGADVNMKNPTLNSKHEPVLAYLLQHHPSHPQVTGSAKQRH